MIILVEQKYTVKQRNAVNGGLKNVKEELNFSKSVNTTLTLSLMKFKN